MRIRNWYSIGGGGLKGSDTHVSVSREAHMQEIKARRWSGRRSGDT